jgi:hypothetical protein
MAKQRRRRRGRHGRGGSPKLEQAKRIVRTLTARGAQRSTTVAAAVHRAGISTRTYRTARKALRTKAIRMSRRRKSRGSGAWFAKT